MVYSGFQLRGRESRPDGSRFEARRVVMHRDERACFGGRISYNARKAESGVGFLMRGQPAPSPPTRESGGAL